MITIDGSAGEGGGQILRTALGLSMVTGQPFRMGNIRAGRKKPGLLRQHLTAVNAAASISDATTDGAVLGATALSFTPGKVRGGEYTFSIGSAGSTTLVLQTVLPALLQTEVPSKLTIEGGTHNPYAPPVDFLVNAFLPLVNRMGPTVSVRLERAGFYPAGGGRVVVEVNPASKLDPLNLPARGNVRKKTAIATICALPAGIARRELDAVAAAFPWSDDSLEVRELPPEQGPGNLLTIQIESEHVTEVFTGFGSKGVSAEAVAREAINEARVYLAVDATVATHLADQLLVPMALCGSGSYSTLPLTRHTTTNADVIRQFIPVEIHFTERGGRVVDVTVG